jgi:hypothetical protein
MGRTEAPPACRRIITSLMFATGIFPNAAMTAASTWRVRFRIWNPTFITVSFVQPTGRPSIG